MRMVGAPAGGWEQKTRMMWKAEQVESGSCLAGQGSNVQGSPRRNPARFGNIQLECQPATIRGPVDQAGETRGLSADEGGSAPVWRGPRGRAGRSLGMCPVWERPPPKVK